MTNLIKTIKQARRTVRAAIEVYAQFSSPAGSFDATLRKNPTRAFTPDFQNQNNLPSDQNKTPPDQNKTPQTKPAKPSAPQKTQPSSEKQTKPTEYKDLFPSNDQSAPQQTQQQNQPDISIQLNDQVKQMLASFGLPTDRYPTQQEVKKALDYQYDAAAQHIDNTRRQTLDQIHKAFGEKGIDKLLPKERQQLVAGLGATLGALGRTPLLRDIINNPNTNKYIKQALQAITNQQTDSKSTSYAIQQILQMIAGYAAQSLNNNNKKLWEALSQKPPGITIPVYKSDKGEAGIGWESDTSPGAKPGAGSGKLYVGLNW